MGRRQAETTAERRNSTRTTLQPDPRRGLPQDSRTAPRDDTPPCRRATRQALGISRQAYYIWYRRYLAEDIEDPRTRSKRPRTSPNATHAKVAGRIIRLRKATISARENRLIPGPPPRCQSAAPASSGSSNAWTRADFRPPSATSATTSGGSATRSSCPATACRSA
ncbi:leucine zipper domain-containing protein [Streptosporangium sp. NPDC049644]|uniref:leucine zipper domain-containing protein n=1 Tax=Streptosporangium sp. NPDC049644 TaxID=3155507 RepID=UPI0034220EA5